MTDVGSLLEEAVQTGRLDSLTIFPSPNWGWQVAIKAKNSDGYVCSMGSDLTALLAKGLAALNRDYKPVSPAQEEDIFG